MNLLERVLTLLRTNLNSVVEQSDDPEKVLRQLQLDMRNQLVQVKTQVATAIAEGHKLQKRSEDKKAEAEKWQEKAEQAVQQGNYDAARAALMHYVDLDKQYQRYQQQKKAQDQLVTTMRSALRRLEAKIAEVETNIDILVTQRRSALLQQTVYETLSKAGEGKDTPRAARAREAILKAQARARAQAELHKQNLDTQLEELSEEQFVERRLNEMKARYQPEQEPPLLQEGHPHISPLIQPQPRPGEPARKKEKENPAQNAPSAHPTRTQDAQYLRKLLDFSPDVTSKD
ncbi:PspA/IM30 family protein [Ktedonosporobacter rubrisoli]|uniref:PspA/IM30 family protein n=1 Tax=Ktedonosporobacter rubrisoli TaxID=2509675 RepID=A0A4P6K111_KTERU|nr:PspA/IM30 family protein [Ktedonosporobacter rubrisoli]QBD81837.1 PspA/IM30 family protein [Ktedonosporobacter rubrisoli]